MRNPIFILFSILLLSLFSCSENDDLISYHKFTDQVWPRYNILHFEIPVDVSENNYDVSMIIRHTKEYEFDYLDFNMLMTTPSGEERIKEYHINVKKRDGGFTGRCTIDSCEIITFLRKDLMLSKGTLIIELENLVPRLEVKGLLSLSIRLHPS